MIYGGLALEYQGPNYKITTVDLDVSTILAEQIKDQFLALSDHGYAQGPRQQQNRPKSNNQKDSSDFAKSLTDSLLKKMDNCCAIMNLPRN